MAISNVGFHQDRAALPSVKFALTGANKSVAPAHGEASRGERSAGVFSTLRSMTRLRKMLCAMFAFVSCTTVIPAGVSLAGLNSLALFSATFDVSVVRDSAGQVERVAGTETPLAYFLETTVDDTAPLDLPGSARDVVVAKVILQGGLSFLGGRDQSGASPSETPKDILFAHVKIVEVRKGHAEVGQSFGVRLGNPSNERRFISPYTPSQLGREYTVVMYVDADDGLRRLVPFPITQLQYAQWKAEASAYMREQSKPGFHQ